MDSPPKRALPRSFFFIIFLFLRLEDALVGAQQGSLSIFLLTIRLQRIIRGFMGCMHPGFINVDCGLPDGSGYQENTTGITYVPDTQYVDAGETKTVAAEGFARRYRTLRVFPEGARNCYNLRPVQPGAKYLVRAEFFYGNYDGLQNPPEFELHIGINVRLTIRLTLNDWPDFSEVIVADQGDTIWVCLVNTNKGTPLISTIQLSPLPNFLYPYANASQSLLLQRRYDFGTNDDLRYPEDPYDRIWEGLVEDLPVISTTVPVATTPTDSFQVSSLVLRTAISVQNVSYRLILRAAVGDPDDVVYAVLHFAELQTLSPPSETRIMDILGEGSTQATLRNYSPPRAVGQTGIYNISLIPSIASTLPPMINAMESFLVRKVNELPTELVDVRVIQGIRAAYKQTRNWQGDPCVPKDYVWDGLRCDYFDGLESPRIISLDLSNNNLSGKFPDFLAELPALKFLILVGNKITLPSEDLCAKVMNGRLSLRFVPHIISNESYQSLLFI
ncbi:unnamed protein product [Spirodela intermedia]|uniref:Malectin-like domain-containing protein n=1 Tax=Spirodela intermedia TaxID=51605 RepID=A0A7I8JC24_SPIIN|nr:unnamed protein product [Spirodela intermedia]CAA6667521.1 unnamed protein product [Spirodela intermedia]